MRLSTDLAETPVACTYYMCGSREQAANDQMSHGLSSIGQCNARSCVSGGWRILNRFPPRTRKAASCPSWPLKAGHRGRKAAGVRRGCILRVGAVWRTINYRKRDGRIRQWLQTECTLEKQDDISVSQASLGENKLTPSPFHSRIAFCRCWVAGEVDGRDQPRTNVMKTLLNYIIQYGSSLLSSKPSQSFCYWISHPEAA